MAATAPPKPEAPKAEDKVTTPAQTEAANAGVRVLRAGESPDVAPVDDFVRVTEDVYEEFYFPGTKRPAYRLLYRAGQTVRQAELDARMSGDDSGASPGPPAVAGTPEPTPADPVAAPAAG